MGRTSSKINRKIEDLLSTNTLPKCAGSSIKKLRKVLNKEQFSKPENVSIQTDIETLSDTCSGATNFSDRLINDSGYFDTALSTLDESFDDSFSTPVKHTGTFHTVPLRLRPLYFEVPGHALIILSDKIITAVLPIQETSLDC